MADEEQSSGDRTEAATPRRLERARDAGQIPVSREIGTFGSLAAVTVALASYSSGSLGQWLGQAVSFIYHSGVTQPQERHLDQMLVFGALRLLWLPLSAAILGGAAATLLQTQLLLHFSALAPKISRVSPAAGLKRIFGVGGLVELLKSLGKLSALGFVIFVIARSDLRELCGLPFQAMQGLPHTVGHAALHVLYAAVGVQAVVAAVDLLWVRYKHAHDLRMSKQDIRDEFKETEGNPQIKARMRRTGFARTRKRMMSRVPSATVVITNPTHYAVALSYDRATNAAPRIVAKGTDHVAAKIREIAHSASVPIVANPPLARALHQLELDTEIPAEHFRAVAQIIAYVWRLRRERPMLG